MKYIRLLYRFSRKLNPHIKNFAKFRRKLIYTGKDGISWSINRRLSLDVLLEKNLGVYHARMDDVLSSCAPNSTAIDVGANAGYWTIPMAYYFDKVIAFEANPIEFSRLIKYITLNKKIATKISPYNLAISDSAGIVHLDIRKSVDGDALLNTGLSSIIEGNSSKSKIQIDSTSLDIMLETRSSAIGLIKIDVEGAEFLVLKGGEEIIANDKPIIFWEAAYSLDLENSRDNVLNVFYFFRELDIKVGL